ncbi:hypothetical protein [Chitinilyticum piscinae]|uniref:Uncharacterized protein n=1 Tax=Chitinilyticum piscinae TaxID=2866724 RepID=A0A8J7FY82_9NEIS|nr:hypothetical protein [Chitinilyticum piscinae]MBE9607898.1 hypothetical protein [Chitinilyticum piscinae]
MKPALRRLAPLLFAAALLPAFAETTPSPDEYAPNSASVQFAVAHQRCLREGGDMMSCTQKLMPLLEQAEREMRNLDRQSALLESARREQGSLRYKARDELFVLRYLDCAAQGRTAQCMMRTLGWMRQQGVPYDEVVMDAPTTAGQHVDALQFHARLVMLDECVRAGVKDCAQQFHAELGKLRRASLLKNAQLSGPKQLELGRGLTFSLQAGEAWLSPQELARLNALVQASDDPRPLLYPTLGPLHQPVAGYLTLPDIPAPVAVMVLPGHVDIDRWLNPSAMLDEVQRRLPQGSVARWRVEPQRSSLPQRLESAYEMQSAEGSGPAVMSYQVLLPGRQSTIQLQVLQQGNRDESWFRENRRALDGLVARPQFPPGQRADDVLETDPRHPQPLESLILGLDIPPDSPLLKHGGLLSWLSWRSLGSNFMLQAGLLAMVIVPMLLVGYRRSRTKPSRKPRRAPAHPAGGSPTASVAVPAHEPPPARPQARRKRKKKN